MAPIDPELLEILVCPETKQPVTPADPSLIDELNALQAEGKLMNRAGEPVKERLDGGLIREDKAFVYPIIDDIPVMLIDEGIPLEQNAEGDASPTEEA